MCLKWKEKKRSGGSSVFEELLLVASFLIFCCVYFRTVKTGASEDGRETSTHPFGHLDLKFHLLLHLLI